MKTTIIFLTALFGISRVIASNPELTMYPAVALDISHNSIVIPDKVDGNGVASQTQIVYGSSASALSQKTAWDDRDTGVSYHEVMLTNLTGSKVFYRELIAYGNTIDSSGTFEAQLQSSPMLYLKLENLPAKTLSIGTSTAQVLLRCVKKCNEQADIYVEYGDQLLLNITDWRTTQAGIDTVEFEVTVPKDVTSYFRPNAFATSGIVSGDITSFVPSIATVGVEEYKVDGFSVYPNPVKDKAIITGNGQFYLYDVIGKEILEIPVKGKTLLRRHEYEIPPGTYLYRYEKSTGKLIFR